MTYRPMMAKNSLPTRSAGGRVVHHTTQYSANQRFVRASLGQHRREQTRHVNTLANGSSRMLRAGAASGKNGMTCGLLIAWTQRAPNPRGDTLQHGVSQYLCSVHLVLYVMVIIAICTLNTFRAYLINPGFKRSK
jgi:hypothetical protein